MSIEIGPWVISKDGTRGYRADAFTDQVRAVCELQDDGTARWCTAVDITGTLCDSGVVGRDWEEALALCDSSLEAAGAVVDGSKSSRLIEKDVEQKTGLDYAEAVSAGMVDVDGTLKLSGDP